MKETYRRNLKSEISNFPALPPPPLPFADAVFQEGEDVLKFGAVVFVHGHEVFVGGKDVAGAFDFVQNRSGWKRLVAGCSRTAGGGGREVFAGVECEQAVEAEVAHEFEVARTDTADDETAGRGKLAHLKRGPARTPRKVLSIVEQCRKSRTKRRLPMRSASVKKSCRLELLRKEARPSIRITTGSELGSTKKAGWAVSDITRLFRLVDEAYRKVEKFQVGERFSSVELRGMKEKMN